MPNGESTPIELVEQCIRHLVRRGYRHAVTSAITEVEANSFLACGFCLRERLHLLRHELSDLPRSTQRRSRRVRPRDHGSILALDQRAFEEFWRLDATGLAEALSATPSSRFRLAGPGILGYSIFGRAGDRGYLQRLAVDPDAQGQGIGTSLVLEGLIWLRRRSVRRVFVNTQLGNDPALSLYRRVGFEPATHGLVVLEANFSDLDDHVGTSS